MPDVSECPNCRRLALEVKRLTARMAALEDELRSGKRQAAPFGKDKPSANPKPPGRKSNHPPAFRPAPPEDSVSEIIHVPLERCPHCTACVERIEDNGAIYQTNPPKIRPVVRRFDTQRG